MSGKIHIYTGDGKGKTTAALGLVLRALGAGKKCAVIFIDKGGTHYSERVMLDKLGVLWFAFGRDRIDPVTKRFDFSITDEDRALGKAALVKAEELMGSVIASSTSPSDTAVSSPRRDVGEGSHHTFGYEIFRLRSCSAQDDRRVRSPRSSVGVDDLAMTYKVDILVLDEFCTSVGVKMIAENEALVLLDKKPPALELILTGRNASDKLRERADLVSRVTMEKHYLLDGMPAREGIDF